MLTYYDILGVSSKADQNEIKEAYRKLQKKYHPDVYQGGDLELATEKIKQVNEAYSVLSDETKKAEYDQRMFGVMPQSSQPSYEQAYYAQQKAQQRYYEQQQAGERNYAQQKAQQDKVNQEFFDRMWKIYYQQPQQKEQEPQPDYSNPFNRPIGNLLKYLALFMGISLLLRFMGFPIFFMLF